MPINVGIAFAPVCSFQNLDSPSLSCEESTAMPTLISHLQAGEGLDWKDSYACFLGKGSPCSSLGISKLSRVQTCSCSSTCSLLEPVRPESGRISGDPLPTSQEGFKSSAALIAGVPTAQGYLPLSVPRGASDYSLSSLHLESNCSLSSSWVPDCTLGLIVQAPHV